MTNATTETIADYQVTVINDSTKSTNRIHGDDMAAKYGFRGGLVPGVNVFGHMTQPLVAALGERWLARGRGEVRLLKPAYDGDELTIRTSTLAANSYEVQCRNAGGELLARMTTELQDKAAKADPLWRQSPATANPPREEICRANIPVGQALGAQRLHPGLAENLRITALLTDRLPLYRKPPSDILASPVHPMWFSHACNTAFSSRWDMPAWMHVGTEFVFHRPLRVDQDIEVRAVPTKVWDNKGHEFATLFVAFVVDGELAIEAKHTAIYKIAERA